MTRYFVTTESDRAEMKRRYREGESTAEIAVRFGINRSTVSHHVCGGRVTGGMTGRARKGAADMTPIVPFVDGTVDRTWMSRATCRDEVMFTEWPIESQLSLCKPCPVRTECAEHGITGPLIMNPQSWDHVHGGLTPLQLRQLQDQRRRAVA